MKFIPQLLAIVFATVWLYQPLTKYFFFQDDFILMDRSNSIIQWQDVFKPSATIFWRPMAEGYFFLAQKIYGLNPYRYHITTLAVHILNALLIWILVSRLAKNSDVGWLTALLFSTSAIHFLSHLWIGEFPIVLGLTWWLLALLVGWLWVQHPTWARAFLAGMLYGLGLLTHELVLLFPIVLFGFLGLYEREHLLKFLKTHLWQFFLILLPGLLYVVVRFIISPIHATGTYGSIGLRDATKSIWWYGVWLWNIPEELKSQAFFPFVLRGEFLWHFMVLSRWWLFELLSLPLLAVVAPWFLASTAEKRKIREHWLYAGILIIGGGAILLLALGHQYPFLLSFLLVGWTMIMASTLVSIQKRSRVGFGISAMTIALWIFSSWLTLRFTEQTHWSVQEALRSQQIVEAAKSQFGSFPSGSTIIVPQDKDGKNKASLADQLGMQIMLNDPSLKTYYGDLLGIIPEECRTVTADQVEGCLKKFIIYRIKV